MRVHPRSIFAALALAGLILTLAPAAAADTLLTLRIQAEGLREPQTSQTWFSGNQLREDKGNRTMIVDAEKNKIWIVLHETKTFHELDLPVDLKSIAPPDMQPFFEQLEQQMNLKVKVQPTEESKQVNGFAAKRVNVEVDSAMGVDLKLKLWMSKDLGFDYAPLKELQKEIAATQPMAKKMVDQVMALSGYPVRTEITTSIQGNPVESSEELISVQEITAPAGTYEPPSNYALKAFDYMKLAPPR